MIAAKLATLKKGDVESQRAVGVKISTPQMSGQQAAELLNVSRDTVQSAKKVLSDGAPEEIAAVESGDAAVSTVAKQIRAKQSPERRKKARDASLSQVGKNPERIQKQQINAEIWGRVRDTLTHLTSLPLPADVVSIVAAHDRTGLVDARLSKSLDWLKEFSDVWASRSQNAA